MRKLGFIINGLIFLIILFPQLTIAMGQGLGRLPLKECWRLESENINSFEIASDNKKLFLSFSDGSVKAIEKQSGKTIWHSDLGGEVVSPIILDNEKIYIASKNTAEIKGKAENNLHIRALSASTGIVGWQRSLQLTEKQEKIYFLDDPDQLFVFTETGSMKSIDKQSGKIYFEKSLDFRISAMPFLSDDVIYIGANNKTVISLSKKDISRIGVAELKNPPTVILASDKKGLFIGDSSGNVISLNSKGESTNWRTWTGAEIVSLTKVSTGLLVSSLDNFVYLLSQKNGKRLWKKRLSGRSVGQPLVRDDVAVFSTLGGTDAVFLELEKGKTINQISLQKENSFINNPADLGDLIIFSTLSGVFAFGSEETCKYK